MTNELLGYIKDALIAVIGLLVAFEIWNPTDQQVAALLTVFGAVGAIILAVNSHRSGGAVQTLRNKAIAAEEAGIVTSEGPPPDTARPESIR